MSIRMEDGENVLDFFRRIEREGVITKGDLLLVGQWKRAQILTLTSQGKDYRGVPFAPYSGKGPYYYTPGFKGSRKVEFGGKARELSLGKIRKLRTFGKQYGADTAVLDDIVKAREKSASYFHNKVKAGELTGVSVKYESYGDFKMRGLGREAVDLTGPSAPHMLQDLIVQVDGSIFDSAPTSVRAMGETGHRVAIGIYSFSADRAEGHNEGIPGKLPQRRFLDITDEDIATMTEMIADRAIRRIASRGGQ